MAGIDRRRGQYNRGGDSSQNHTSSTQSSRDISMSVEQRELVDGVAGAAAVAALGIIGGLKKITNGKIDLAKGPDGQHIDPERQAKMDAQIKSAVSQGNFAEAGRILRSNTLDSNVATEVLQDNPDFNLEHAKDVVTELLKDVVYAYETGDTAPMAQYKPGVRDAAERAIRELKRWRASDINILKAYVSGYEKAHGSSTIKFTITSLGFKNGVKSGPSSQISTIVDYTSLFAGSDSTETDVSLRCNHCGAPVNTVGARKCEFCGNDIILNLEKTWEVTGITIQIL